MLKKLILIIIPILVLNQTAVLAVGENNTKLQLLLQKAKARREARKPNIKPTAPAQIQAEKIIQPFVQEQAPVEHHHHHAPVAQVPQAAPVHHAAAPLVQKQAPVVHHAAPVQKQTHHPVVLETHPAAKPAVVVHAPAPNPAPVVAPKPAPAAVKYEPKVQKTHQPNPYIDIKHETKVVQPPVTTLGSTHSSQIHTETVSQTTITTGHTESHSTTEEAHEAKSPANAYDEVAVYINSLLGRSTKTDGNVIELRPEEIEAVSEPTEPVVEEIPEPSELSKEEAEIEIPAVPEEPVVAKVEEPVKEEDMRAVNLDEKESDYLLIIRKSLKSLEDDPWVKVKNNMIEAMTFFEQEIKLSKKNGTEDPEVYQKIVLACKKFSEGGLELDEGDFADFEEAEALYLDTQDLLKEASQKVKGKTDYKSQQIQDIIDALTGYTTEELEYIEEMIGM
ncbi:MAG: hypothetical protein HOA17_08705 [Candidatus Melainabacteria bacterium]|jgi:hypothetical protein|nr:hypothetical protein [Candidatus Melainabacteria bacterium]